MYPNSYFVPNILFIISILIVICKGCNFYRIVLKIMYNQTTQPFRKTNLKIRKYYHNS